MPIIDEFTKSLANLTRNNYKSDLRGFARWRWPDLLEGSPLKSDILSLVPDEDWLELKPGNIAEYQNHLINKSGLSPATIARRLVAITGLLRFAKTNHGYPPDLYEIIDQQTKSKKKDFETDHHSNISPEVQNKLLEAAAGQPGAKGDRDYLIVRLFLETGIRRFELCNLKCKDVSIKDGQPSISVLIAKGGSARTIGIEEDTYDLLKDWLSASGQNQDEDWPIFCPVRKKGKGNEARYMASNQSKPLSPITINRLVTRLVNLAGLKPDETKAITPHCFRVANITDAVEGDAPLLHIQNVAGHSDGRMIKDIYNRHKHKAPLSTYRKHKLYKKD